MEIHPLNQSRVDRPCSGSWGGRSWDCIVDAWAAGDDQALDDAWVEQIVDLGS